MNDTQNGIWMALIGGQIYIMGLDKWMEISVGTSYMSIALAQ